MGVDRSAMDKERRTPFFKPKEGNNLIFVCPPSEGRKKPWKEVYMHYEIGVNNITVVCPNKINNEPCPVCEKSGMYYAKGTDEAKAIAKKFWPKVAWYAYIVNLKEQDLKVQTFRFSIMVHEQLVNCFYDDEDPDRFMDYTKLIDGYKVVLTRTDKSAKENHISYSAHLSRNPYKFEDPKAIIGQMGSLNQFGEILSYDEIKEIMDSEYIPDNSSDEKEVVFADERRIENNKSQLPAEVEADELPMGATDFPPKENSEVKDENLAVENADPKGVETQGNVNTVASKPKCHGKEYSIDDDGCLECVHEETCAKAMLKKGK